ncbi:MAG: hypothetical protein ACI9FD_002614 [Gammaproteobacteria bacterium]|jgi:hypothetical protein
MKILFTIILTIWYSALTQANNVPVTSSEYKLMLKPELFSRVNESVQVDKFLHVLKMEIETATNRTIDGVMSLKKDRLVTFYDVPQICKLKNRRYSFRARVDSDGDSEVTLKFRSLDRAKSSAADVSSEKKADTKLEADIGVVEGNDFKVVYSHSNSISSKRNINKMKDINVLFPGFRKECDLDDELPLVRVGGLSVQEHVYKGATIDLGDIDAKISLTLWYDKTSSNSQTPVVAEVSFNYKKDFSTYNKKVVKRAKYSFIAMQNLTKWTAPNSKTKTSFIYDFDKNFCAPKQPKTKC